jgi:GWxTD domain-containing protein
MRFAFALTLLLIPGLVSAQPTDTTFRAFYQSLSDITAAELESMVEGTNLQAGFAALEMHRRTNNQAHAFRATRIFGQIVKKKNDQPWAHLGLAKALIRSPKSINVIRAMGVANEGAGQEVILVEIHTQLQRALLLDPQLNEARTMLADFAEVPSAVVPATPSYTEGAAYFETITAADEAMLQKLIRDIAIIASPQEMLSLTQGDFAKRRTALRLFWKKRSVRDGISEATRVVEHYRRIHYARKQYGPPVPYYNAYGKKRVGLEAEMDDRGLIYVRFGQPHNLDFTTDEVSEGQQKRGSQLWAYLQPDGRWHTYIFSARGSLIADPMKEMAGRTGTANRQSDDKLMEMLRRYDARYHFIGMRDENLRLWGFMARANPELASQARIKAFEASEDASRQNERIVERNRRMLFAAFDMDAARPRFPQPLLFFHDFATFRGRSNCTDVVYSVAAPVPSYQLTLAVADTFTWDAQTIDTTVAANVRPGEFLRASGVFCSTPDYNSYVRLTATVDSSMGTTAGGELRIPNYSASALMMSDLLFGTTVDGAFVRGRARLSLVPPRQFKEGEAFRVFYELYNLPAGRAYRTEISLTSTEGNVFSRLFKGRTKTTVTFEGVAEGRDVVQELRTLIPQIQSGEAEVLVKVTDLVTGETAQNKETIWIIPAD